LRLTRGQLAHGVAIPDLLKECLTHVLSILIFDDTSLKILIKNHAIIRAYGISRILRSSNAPRTYQPWCP
jgi:hypothetical protein